MGSLGDGPAPPERPHAVRLSRRQTCSFPVRVVDGAGSPLPDVGVKAHRLVEDLYVRGYANDIGEERWTDVNGHATLDLPAGETELEVSGRGDFSKIIVRSSAVAPESSRTIVLRRYGRVRVDARTPKVREANLNLFLVDEGTRVDRCYADASGVWTADEVPPSRPRAALMANVYPSTVRRGSYFTGGSDNRHPMTSRVLLALSPPFDVPEGGVADVVMKPAIGMLRLQCTGDAESVDVAIDAEDGRPLRLDQQARPQPTYRCSASRLTVVVPLPVGRFRISVDDRRVAPFETTVTIVDGGSAAAVVPVRLLK